MYKVIPRAIIFTGVRSLLFKISLGISQNVGRLQNTLHYSRKAFHSFTVD